MGVESKNGRVEGEITTTDKIEIEGQFVRPRYTKPLDANSTWQDYADYRNAPSGDKKNER